MFGIFAQSVAFICLFAIVQEQIIQFYSHEQQSFMFNGVLASEFPERECCDPVYPPPVPTAPSSSAATPTGRSGPNIKTAIAILNCLLARQLCFEDVSCSAILEIIPRVCGPELVACSTVTVTKCQAALRTLQAFPFFKPTCLCREPHVDPECNSFRDFLFDHPCVFVLKKEKDPYPVDALPTCNHALSVCQREEKCIKLFEDFKTNCKVRDNKCRMDDRELCHESWTNLRLSPMFGCICPNNHMKRRCDRIFGIVNHNPCVDMLPISLDLSGTESALYPNNPENGYFNSLWLPPTKTNQYPYFLHPATNRPRTYLHITSNIISPSPSIHQMHHFNNHHHHYAQSGTFMPVSTSGTSHKSSSSSVADSDYNHQLSIEETLNTPLEFDELPSEDIVVTVTRLSGGSADVKVISPSKNASAGITYDVEFESQLKNPLVDFSGSMGHEHHRHMPDGPRDILGIDRGEFPHHHNYTSGEEYHLHHHQRHSSPSDITKFAFKSTCHLALENCNNDYMCRAALQPVLHHCDTSQCHRNSCMEALQNLYRKPELSWSLEIAFCLCKTSENKQDACLVAQEKLHPICAQRVEGNQVLPPCHTLAEECRKDIDCKIRLEFYEQSCAVDSTTKKCAGPPSECRAAMLGILGTELRTTCGCKGTDFTQLYDCLGWQRLLWVNPCVVQSQSDFHIKNAAIELAKMSTTPTTTIQPIASTWRSRIQLSTTLAPITTITMETTTLTTEPTEPTTTEMITTTTSTTTSTTPPRFCVVQKPHQTTQYIREGKSKRLNRDDELECSDLCQCAESLIVICHTICVDRIPCKTEFAFYNHAAPAYQAYRGRCLCYSGQFICMRPTPGEYKLPQGVFLFLGYSETDEALLKPHSNLSVQDVVQSLQELIMHETSCQLSIFNVTKANVILVAKIRDDDEEDETKILIKEQEQCAQILEDISEKINTQHPEFNSHLLLSIFKMAEVEVIPAKINAQQRQTTSSPVLIILSTILVLHRVIIRSTSSWHFLHHL